MASIDRSGIHKFFVTYFVYLRTNIQAHRRKNNVKQCWMFDRSSRYVVDPTVLQIKEFAVEFLLRSVYIR